MGKSVLVGAQTTRRIAAIFQSAANTTQAKRRNCFSRTAQPLMHTIGASFATLHARPARSVASITALTSL